MGILYEDFMKSALKLNSNNTKKQCKKIITESTSLNEATGFNSPNIYPFDTFIRKFFNGSFIQHSDGTLPAADFEFGWSNPRGSNMSAEDGVLTHHIAGLRNGKFKNAVIFIPHNLHSKIHNEVFKRIKSAPGIGDEAHKLYDEYTEFMNSATDNTISANESELDESSLQQIKDILKSTGNFSEADITRSVDVLNSTLVNGVSEKSAISKLNVKFAKKMSQWWKDNGDKYIDQYRQITEDVTNKMLQQYVDSDKEVWTVSIEGGPSSGGTGAVTKDQYNFSIELSKFPIEINMLTLDIQGTEIPLEKISGQRYGVMDNNINEQDLVQLVNMSKNKKLVLLKDDIFGNTGAMEYYATDSDILFGD